MWIYKSIYGCCMYVWMFVCDYICILYVCIHTYNTHSQSVIQPYIVGLHPCPGTMYLNQAMGSSESETIPDTEPSYVPQNETASIANVCMYVYLNERGSIRVLVRLCMYVCMYVCTVCIYVCMYVLYVCMYVWVYTCCDTVIPDEENNASTNTVTEMGEKGIIVIIQNNTMHIIFS